ncbi:MAG: flippase-like domain-containing protein [candidate division Zixibacteria bacterium]|nr:flippase-like domain-containing protein [candidate division Zixibacteria bacterium]
MSKKLLAAFGIAVSALFLYLFLKDVHWGELGTALRQANYLWLIPNIILIFLTMLLRAWRWGYLVNPVKKCSFHGLYAATMIGFMASNILPARLGELVRPLSLGKIEGVSRSAALATTAVERVFDLVTLLALFTAVIFYKNLPETPILAQIEKAGWAFLIVTIVSVVIWIMLKVKTDLTLRALNKVLRIFPERIQETGSDILVKFASGLQVLSDVKAILIIGGQSALIWVLLAVSNYSVFLAFGLPLPLDASFLVLAIVSVGIMLPSGPGFIGLYQYLTVISLDLYDVPRAAAEGVGIIMWATQYFVITFAGLYHLKKEHLSLKKVEEEENNP